MISFWGIMWYVAMIGMFVLSVVTVIVGIQKARQLAPSARQGLLDSWRLGLAPVLLQLMLISTTFTITVNQPASLTGEAKAAIAGVIAFVTAIMVWNALDAIQRVRQTTGGSRFFDRFKIQSSRTTA